MAKVKRKDITLRVVNSIKPGYFYLKKDDFHNFVKNRLEFMEPSFLELLKLNSGDFKQLNEVSSTSFYVFGMIKVEDSNNIFLYSNIKGNNDVCLKLNLDYLERYSLFSGQILALKGKNIGNNEFITELIQCMPMIDINSEQSNIPFRLRVVSGDVEDIDTSDIDVLILIDVRIEKFKKSLEDWVKADRNNKVILVPSPDDEYSSCIFPQVMDQSISSFFIICTNPVEIMVNGFLISINTWDILSELKKEEISFCDKEKTYDLRSRSKVEDPCGKILFKGDRIERLCYHVLFQRCFIPVTPSAGNVQYNADSLSMRICPDLYILKSKIEPFEKDIGPSKIVNIGDRKILNIEQNNGEFIVK